MTTPVKLQQPHIQSLLFRGERAKNIADLFQKTIETQDICIQLAQADCFDFAVEVANQNLSANEQMLSTVLQRISGWALEVGKRSLAQMIASQIPDDFKRESAMEDINQY